MLRVVPEAEENNGSDMGEHSFLVSLAGLDTAQEDPAFRGLSDGAYRLLMNLLISCSYEGSPLADIRVDPISIPGFPTLHPAPYESRANAVELFESGLIEPLYDEDGEPVAGTVYVPLWEKLAR